MIDQLPTNCAPTEGTNNQIGWSNCIQNCEKCKQCDPDPNTSCGQMLIASGETDCVPPNCFNQCCKNSLISQLETLDGNKHPKRLMITLIIILILTIILGIYILSNIVF